MISRQNQPAPFSTNPEENPPAKARQLFPRGLFQPEGSFRFSLASLLPAAFAQLHEVDDKLADLGAGCGAAGFAALLRLPRLQVTAVEREHVLCEAIQRNAALLGLTEGIRVVEADLSESLPEDLRASAGVVLANPPYRRKGHGRLPPSGLRARALFEDGPHTLPDFCRAAAFCLCPEGRFIAVYPAERLADLRGALEAAGLGLSRLRPVRSFADTPDSLVLTEARPSGFCGPAEPFFEAPLVLHHKMEGQTFLTREALEFCPELDGNARDSISQSVPIEP